MFKEYLREIKEAIDASDLFDRTFDSVTISIGDSTTYNGLPVRTGKLLYGQTVLAVVYISAIPKPVHQFYENDVHVSAGGFDAIHTASDKIYYMIGSWCLRCLAFQPPLCDYPGGSNFKAFYDEYIKHLEKMHKEEYDNEYEESD